MSSVFQNDSIQVAEHPVSDQDKIALVSLDMPNKSANVLTNQMFADIKHAWEFVADRSWIGAVIYSKKPKIFVAGADLVAIVQNLDWPDMRIVEFCDQGREIFRGFRSLEFPVIAAVHGACVGGGFELALWCDERIATNDRCTIFGLPEVKLGLVPGWAGTCLLPRMIGVKQAAEAISLAGNLSADQARQLGAVAKVVEPEALISASIERIHEQNESREYIQKRELIQGPAAEPDVSIESLRSEIVERIKVTPEVDDFAAEIVLDQVLSTWDQSLNDACDSESQAMVKVWGSDSCAGLLNSFFLNERARKSGTEITAQFEPPELTSIGIIGCGQMGAGIAELYANAGFQVTLHDLNIELAETVAESIRGNNESADVVVAQSIDATADCDLFIESIVEYVPAKRELFAEICRIGKPDAVIATNTSVIPLQQMVDSVSHPDRFLGMHFCSPVAYSQVVEVVRGESTGEPSLAAAIAAIRKIRKHPIVVNDGHGFVINRVLAAMFDEANRQLLSGTDYPAIDQGLREFGFPAGPFEIMDVIGNDVVYHAGKASFTLDKNAVFLSPIQPKMVKHDLLGFKNQLGYYDYRDFDLTQLPFQQAPLNPAAVELVEAYQQSTAAIEPAQSRQRILLMMLAVACQILDDQIVTDPRDVDICLQFGLQFPARQGGLFFWADRMGIPETIRQFTRYQQSVCQTQFATPHRLQTMAEAGTTFYG